MSSAGAAFTADNSRVSTVLSSDADYRVVLPQLPTGALVLNSVFLHCDMNGTTYRIEDFRSPLDEAGVLKEVKAIGAFQMNHVWFVTLKSAAVKQKLMAIKELQVKNRRCIVFDPNKVETRLKLHWVSFYVADAHIREALEPYGKVEQVTRETWRAEGFEGVESTTRSVRIVLKQSVTLDQLPHQLRLPGGNALVVVPGRAPLCLRCKTSGHIRKDCRVPRCDSCRRFGHKDDECVRTFAKVASAGVEDVASEVAMDEAEAESTSKSSEEATECRQEASDEGALSPTPEERPEAEVVRKAREDVPRGDVDEPSLPEAATTAAAAEDEAPVKKIQDDGDVEQAEVNMRCGEPSNTHEDGTEDKQGSQTTKRPLEADQSPEDNSETEGTWKLATSKRHPRYHPAPRITPTLRKPKDV